MAKLEGAWPRICECDFYTDFLKWKVGMEESVARLANIAASLQDIRRKFDE